MYAGSYAYASNQYQNVSATSGVDAADSHGLIRLLLSTAIDRIAAARIAFMNGNAQVGGQRIGQAAAIVTELRSSLDHEQGGDIAGKLDSLYDYMQRRLMHANRRRDQEALLEVMDLISEIHTAWNGIRQ